MSRGGWNSLSTEGGVATGGGSVAIANLPNEVGGRKSNHEATIGELLRDLHTQLSRHHRGLLASSRAFLPDIVADAINANELEPDRLIVKRCDGAVVFSDASGFTALTERLAQKSNGAELLSTCLNKFFTPLIDMLTAYRGDVIKFSGDALTILFAANSDGEAFLHACGSPCCSHAPLELACLRAAACCIEIHKRLHNFDTGEGDVRLTLHIGVGAGPVTILQVGGRQGRYEYVIAGEPLAQIAVAEPLAGSGETVLSPQCWGHVQHTVTEGEPIESNPGYHRLKALDITKHTYPTVKQAARQSAVKDPDGILGDEELERRLTACMRFIPRSVLKQFRTGSLRGINEMRTVSIIFVQVQGVDVSSDEGAVKAKELMDGMQKICYSEEGSLNKFLVDDKGLLFLFVFGLPPLVHIDDPTRACRACLAMSDCMAQMDLIGRIGVTTGRVYCGMVGSNTRREYTVMGDTVNLSARLMANAAANTVLVDEATFKRCDGEFAFLRLHPIRVKGKENQISIYRPVTTAAPPPAGQAGVAEVIGSTRDLKSYAFKVVRLPSRQEATVRLPWPPRGALLGGLSPLTQMQSWSSLERIHRAAGRCLTSSGTVLVVSGPRGSGKEELVESVLHRCVNDGMVPVFGTMQMREAEVLNAPREVIAQLLALLHRRPGEERELSSSADFVALLQREALSPDEADALQSFHGLRRGLSQSFERQESEYHTREDVICAFAGRLLRKALEVERFVVCMRCWRGTTLSPCDTSLFWRLARHLQEVCATQAPGRALLIVLSRDLSPAEEHTPVATRSKARRPTMRNSAVTHLADPLMHSVASSSRQGMTGQPSAQGVLAQDAGLDIPHEVVAADMLTEEEAHVFIGLVLGVGTAERPTTAVPETLRTFLSSIALNNPRNILEALQQLREEQKIRVVDGRVELLVDLNTVGIADWVHTGMVGSIISTIEMMGAEAQSVIKHATVFDGPFSALDVASANRVHRPSSDLLAFHDSVQLLMSCEWLVGIGFLNRFHYQSFEVAADGQTWRLPRWEISNLLIRKVVGATLLESQRMQIKRAVLVARCLNIQLPRRMRAKAELHEELFGKQTKAEKMWQQRRRESLSQWETHTDLDRGAGESERSGLPSSCIVLPAGSAAARGGQSLREHMAIMQQDGRGDVFLMQAHDPPSGGRGVLDRGPGQRRAPLKPGGDPSMPDLEQLGDWLLLMAAAGHQAETLQLIERGAPAAVVDVAGLAPIHFACAHGDAKVVAALVSALADPMAKASGFGTPLEIAAAHGHMAVTRYLADECDTTVEDGKWVRQLAEPVPSVVLPPGPLLGGARNRVQDVNYQRSQTLIFLQDYIEEEAREAAMEQLGTVKAQHTDRKNSGDPQESAIASLLKGRSVAAILLAGLLLAIFGPDLVVLAGGSQAALDNVLFVVMLIFALHIAATGFVNPSYLRTLFFSLDVIGTLAIALEISWLFGPSENKPMSVDKPLDGRSGSYNIVLARAARAAGMGIQATRFSCVMRIMNRLCLCCVRPSAEADFHGIESFRTQLMNGISAHVGLLTILLIVTVPLLSFLKKPNKDESMLAWAMVLSGYYENQSSPMWRQEVAEFEQFYSHFSYGPYLVCEGVVGAQGCEENRTVWGSSGSGLAEDTQYFGDPDVEASRLRIDGGALSIAFDFTEARRMEALMNIMLVVFAFVVMAACTLLISLAVSDLVLRPLQRMLTSVKKIAMPILGDTASLGSAAEDGELQQDDEIAVLEQIVQKLGKIAGIAATLTVGEDPDRMKELKSEDRGVLQMMFRKNQAEDKDPAPRHGSQNRGHASEAAGSSGGRAGAVHATGPRLGSQRSWADFDPHPNDDFIKRLGAIEVPWETIDSWNFNVLKIDRQKQLKVASWIVLQNASVYQEVKPSPEVTNTFLTTLCGNYKAELPFHTFMHAVDVLHMIWRFMLLSKAHMFLSGLEQFALLVSAASHDVGHMGHNNPFLIEVSHELAMRYNDRSPLENMHCATMFQILSSTPGANVFESLRRSDFFECRRLCIEAILHTDMVHHFEMVKDTHMLYQMNMDGDEKDPAMIFHDKETKQKVMNLFLHSADVSNPCKPWALCHEWAMRCLEEFFNQGDQEKKLGIPVQMLNDRTKVNKPFSQIGFMEFMIVPLEAAKVKLFPSLFETAEHLSANIQEWNRLWVEEVGHNDEQREKVQGRVNKACDVLAEAQASGLPYLGFKSEEGSAAEHIVSTRHSYRSNRSTASRKTHDDPSRG